MILLVVFCIFSLASAGEYNPRIVGGRPIQIQTVPYQLSLEYYGQHRCGAVLISTTRALTAAHCTIGVSANALRVRGGSSVLGSGGQVVAVSRIIQNPNYDPNTQDYDISVLHLATNLRVDSGVQPVELATQTPAVNTNAIASGWGALREGGTVSRYLQGVILPIIGQHFCQLSHQGAITERMLCAGVFRGGQDSCQGDSGGPLVANGVLVGLVSWGIGCGRASSPGVYTNVAVVRSFIRETSGV